MRAELKLDCYQGNNCDETEPYWRTYAEGDKEGMDSNFKESLELSPEAFPAGTKIIVSIPVCPECEMDCELCDCGFDWKGWAENKYS